MGCELRFGLVHWWEWLLGFQVESRADFRFLGIFLQNGFLHVLVPWRGDWLLFLSGSAVNLRGSWLSAHAILFSLVHLDVWIGIWISDLLLLRTFHGTFGLLRLLVGLPEVLQALHVFYVFVLKGGCRLASGPWLSIPTRLSRALFRVFGALHASTRPFPLSLGKVRHRFFSDLLLQVDVFGGLNTLRIHVLTGIVR